MLTAMFTSYFLHFHMFIAMYFIIDYGFRVYWQIISTTDTNAVKITLCWLLLTIQLIINLPLRYMVT